MAKTKLNCKWKWIKIKLHGAKEFVFKQEQGGSILKSNKGKGQNLFEKFSNNLIHTQWI